MMNVPLERAANRFAEKVGRILVVHEDGRISTNILGAYTVCAYMRPAEPLTQHTHTLFDFLYVFQEILTI